ncbi:hypothetical protein BGW37DRAFT_402167, partial [Umbelopsis sp. PMI_123]
WIACKVCKEQLKPLPMSLPTYKYSFGKYLELLLYDKEFMPPKTMCEHSTDRQSVLRCFQHKGVIIQFDYEDIELFEMRVPRLQVVLPEEGSVEDSENSDHESTLFQAEGEVDSFFSAVDRHIKLLQEYLVAEDKLERQSATFFLGQSKAQGLRAELDQLQLLFNQERDNLLRGLDKLVGDEMNDFNRWFAIKVKSVMDSLLLWQETNCPELDVECVWDPMPDWIKSESVHLFPGSSVPVREDEPSSIIAHTLSSKDYLEELEQKPIITRSFPSSSTSSAAAFTTTTKQKNTPVYRELLHGFYSTVGRERVSIGNSLANVHAPASLRTTLLETIRDMNVTERIGSRMTNFNQIDNHKNDRHLELLSSKLALTDQQNTSLPTEYVHNGTQFSCTVYFAREFDELRQRCGIDKLIIQSLSRCENWSASGGKSKSTFFKTKDNRLVLKQMVSSWNVAERDALLRFAPKYFAYLKRSAGAPSVLAKIFGFYTVKIRKLAEDKTTLKMDILVMEHLFYGQNISRRFDLKGIQGRHVDEVKKSAELTLWDGDWVEVGIDDEKKEMIVGIVGK